ncbi:MAG: hypothetical protein Hals2KO_38910 [Halioglobus sp.]
MTRHTAIPLLLALILGACSDGADETLNTEGQQVSLVTYFPPPEARYRQTHIAVHGRLTHTLESSPQITVDGGAGPVVATLSDDGQWIAEGVPLPDDHASITVAVSANGAVISEKAVSFLHRISAQPLPVAVAGAPEGGDLFLKFAGGDLRQYSADGTERQRFSFALDEASSHPQLAFWPATGEWVFLSSPRGGGCVVHAYDPQQSTLRALAQLDRGPESFVRDCRFTAFAVSTARDSIAVLDNVRQTLSLLGIDASVQSSTSLPDPFANIVDVFPVPGQPEQLALLWEDTFLTETNLRYERVESSSGSLLDSVEYPQVFRYGEGLPLVAPRGEATYLWLDGTHALLSTDSAHSDSLEVSGFVPVDVVDVSAGVADEVLHLDRWGRLSALDVTSTESRAIGDVAPFVQPPIGFFDNTSVGGIFISTSHALLGPGPRGGFVRSWENLHHLDVNTLRYEPVYGTGGYENSFAPVSRTFFSIQITPADLVSSDYSVQRATDFEHRLELLSHHTGERARFNLGELVLSEQDQFKVGADGEHLVLLTQDAVYDYAIASQQLTRSFTVAAMPPNLDLAMRFPGADGAIYFTDRPFFNIYRADFANQRLELVSGLGRGDGPTLGPLLDSSKASWSHEDNAVYFGAGQTPSYTRVDLDSGARALVFSRADAVAFELPEFPGDIRYLQERNALLVSAENGVFYLDLRTGSSVAIPLQPARQ